MPPLPAGVAAMIGSSHAARRWRRHGHRIERLLILILVSCRRRRWYGAAGLRLQTPPTPLIDALHCCKVAKVQLGEVPSLNWAQ
jgi:hypothetical protein